MANLYEDLFRIADRLDSIFRENNSPEIKTPLDKLEEAVQKVGKSWSGSWLGYQSRIYYHNLQTPPPGAWFSQESGLMDRIFNEGTVGDWEEFDFDQVRQAIYEIAGNPELGNIEKVAKDAQRVFEDDREEALSLLITSLEERKDSFLERLKEEVEKLKIHNASYFLNYLRPTGQFMTSDTVAIGQGIQVPPHYSVLADLLALRQPLVVCDKLGKVTRRAASHLMKRERYARREREIGTNVFIGHGNSNVWKNLKDFIQDRLGLPWDEFNRVPVAGIINIARLSQMLNDAAIAFLVMTAEDEQADGKLHARLNVVHESGLFQGRLGFTKAIILLEEGCEEFSNIEGLGQIRFPKGKIEAIFEEVRRVLEREGILSSS